MDNIRARQIMSVPETIEATGSKALYVPPPYSPDFHPIEKFFAKIESALGRVAAPADDALDAAVTQAFRSFTSRECTHLLCRLWRRCRSIEFRQCAAL